MARKPTPCEWNGEQYKRIADCARANNVSHKTMWHWIKTFGYKNDADVKTRRYKHRQLRAAPIAQTPRDIANFVKRMGRDE